MNASPLLDKHWHHVCITWTNNEGKLNFYVDGSVKKTKTEFKTGAVIKGGGVAWCKYYKYCSSPVMPFTDTHTHTKKNQNPS